MGIAQCWCHMGLVTLFLHRLGVLHLCRRAKLQIIPKHTGHITPRGLWLQLGVLGSLEMSLQKVHRNYLNKQRGVGRMCLCTECFVCVFPLTSLSLLNPYCFFLPCLLQFRMSRCTDISYSGYFDTS